MPGLWWLSSRIFEALFPEPGPPPISARDLIAVSLGGCWYLTNKNFPPSPSNAVGPCGQFFMDNFETKAEAEAGIPQVVGILTGNKAALAAAIALRDKKQAALNIKSFEEERKRPPQVWCNAPGSLTAHHDGVGWFAGSLSLGILGPFDSSEEAEAAKSQLIAKGEALKR